MATRRSERTDAAKGDRREQALLGAARRSLDRGQFATASVGTLATEAGISRATFYFYFASKTALLGTVISQAVGELEDRFEAAIDASGTAAEAIEGAVRAAADLWRDQRVVLVAAVELAAVNPEVYERSRTSIANMVELTVSILRRTGHPETHDDPVSFESLITALVLMSERNFYDFARQIPGPVHIDAERLVTTLTTVWVRTLKLD